MSVVVRGITFTGDPCRVVTGTVGGRTITAGECTMAHLIAFDDWLRKRKGCYLVVLQGAYNTGVAASAGTHNYDTCIDFLVVRTKTGRRQWIRGQRMARYFDWDSWWRHTGTWYQPSSWHHHGISHPAFVGGCPTGIYVPGQHADYHADPPRNGLAGHDTDRSWHPQKRYGFDYEKWMEDQDMPSPKDWDAEDWAAVQKHVLDAPMNLDPSKQDQFTAATVRSVLKDLWRAATGKK